MNSITLEASTELVGQAAAREVVSMYQALHQLTAGPRKQGQQYSLPLVLTSILLAKAAGETTLQARSRVDSVARKLAAKSLPSSRAILSVCGNRKPMYYGRWTQCNSISSSWTC